MNKNLYSNKPQIATHCTTESFIMTGFLGIQFFYMSDHYTTIMLTSLLIFHIFQIYSQKNLWISYFFRCICLGFRSKHQSDGDGGGKKKYKDEIRLSLAISLEVE